jgi:hypothetical protein
MIQNSDAKWTYQPVGARYCRDTTGGHLCFGETPGAVVPAASAVLPLILKLLQQQHRAVLLGHCRSTTA